MVRRWMPDHGSQRWDEHLRRGPERLLLYLSDEVDGSRRPRSADGGAGLGRLCGRTGHSHGSPDCQLAASWLAREAACRCRLHGVACSIGNLGASPNYSAHSHHGRPSTLGLRSRGCRLLDWPLVLHHRRRFGIPYANSQALRNRRYPLASAPGTTCRSTCVHERRVVRIVQSAVASGCLLALEHLKAELLKTLLHRPGSTVANTGNPLHVNHSALRVDLQLDRIYRKLQTLGEVATKLRRLDLVNRRLIGRACAERWQQERQRQAGCHSAHRSHPSQGTR